MSLARLVVTAVTLEGRTKAEVSREYGVSPRWVYELCWRFELEGDAAEARPGSAHTPSVGSLSPCEGSGREPAGIWAGDPPACRDRSTCA
jgi:hypothetical protein